MIVEKKPLSQLQRPTRNVRIHSDTQIKEYMRSVEMFGQIRPIVIDETNSILAGNGLYDALLQLGRTEADCYVVSGLSESEKKKLMLADNRIFNLGVDDLKAFDEIVLELGNDFDIPGYDPDLLETLSFDLSDADDMMSGYGIISEDTKQEMKKAEDQYKKDEAVFVEKSEEYHPAPQVPESTPTTHPIGSDTPIASDTPSPAEPPARKYITCPKCGEKIWL